MSKFIMLVGIPASGKDTLARQYAAEHTNVVIHSSDDIRVELCGSIVDQSKNARVFEIMRSRSLCDIQMGKDVIYNATNLSYRKRRAILQAMKKEGAFCEAVVIVCPPEMAKQRNAARENPVPEYVIDRMARSFQMPFENEGFDSIRIVNTTHDICAIAQLHHDFVTFGDQHNPHHSLSLWEHCRKCNDYAQKFQNGSVSGAAAFHDIGKSYTQSFDEEGVAHYYGHAEYGSYVTMCIVNDVEIAQLVCYHMKPYAKQESEVWKTRLGEALWNKIEQLHECDVAAH